MNGALLESLFGVVGQVLGLIGSANAMKLSNQLTQAKLDLLKEKAKGYQADDSKIENLEKQIPVLLEGVQNEINIYRARGPVSAAVSTVGSDVASAVSK